MKKKNSKSIYDFDYLTLVHIPYHQQEDVRKVLNLLYVGDEKVNKVNEDGKIVAKYDDHPNFKALQETHYAINRHYKLTLKMGVDKNGRVFIKGFKQ